MFQHVYVYKNNLDILFWSTHKIPCGNADNGEEWFICESDNPQTIQKILKEKNGRGKRRVHRQFCKIHKVETY